MFDASPEIAALIMFASLLVLLMSGLHVVFALGGAGVLSILLIWGPKALPVTASSAFAVTNSYTLMAIPMFVFLAVILERSGIAEALFKSIRLWLARVPGGLAMGVVFICTIIAAMSGIAATGLVTMGIVALPIMLRLGYNKTIAIGPIMAGGALGFLIPPSVPFIVYGIIAEVSIGALFLGGIFPGFVLSFLYISYIGIRCALQPELGPPLPPEERGSFKEKILSLRSVFLPALLIMGVLGTIFLGIASPTEASAVGAAGAVLCAAINRQLSWQMIKYAVYQTIKIACMCMWIVFGAFIFKAVFVGIGGPQLASAFIGNLDVAPIVIILLMQASYMFLGCFIDEVTTILITIPVYLPIVIGLGYDPVWFGVLYLVNMQMSMLTPPFGFGLFYMRGVAPPGITIGDIYRSIIPFIPLQLVGVLLVLFFPQLALWLPSLVFG